VDKKIILALVLLVTGIFFLIGSIYLKFDLRPMGIAVGLLVSGIVWGICGFQKRKGNNLLVFGNLLCFLGIAGAFATIAYLPDSRPLITSIIAAILGLVLMGFGFQHSVSEGREKGLALVNVLGVVTSIALFGIALMMFSQIQWEFPGNPAAVMILSALSGLGVLLGIVFNHHRKVLLVVAGLISIVNFFLIPIYEGGTFDFLGEFYRKLEPLYARLDPWAEIIEYTLIGVTIVLAILLIIKNKARVSSYGSVTLLYLLLQPIFAILLYEMMGNLTAGSTTRAELLATNTMAVMETIGMIFIADFFYILFQLTPFWVPPVLAGLWWPFWKVWMLHHPTPEIFMAEYPQSLIFPFLTAIKRVALPMVLIILLMQLFQHKKAAT
jgi:hypothetical protein